MSAPKREYFEAFERARKSGLEPDAYEEKVMLLLCRHAWHIARERQNAHGGTDQEWRDMTPDKRLEEMAGELQEAAEELGLSE